MFICSNCEYASVRSVSVAYRRGDLPVARGSGFLSIVFVSALFFSSESYARDYRDDSTYARETRGYSLSEFNTMRGVKTEPVVVKPSWLEAIGNRIASTAQWWHGRNENIVISKHEQPIRFIYGNGIGNPSVEGQMPDYAALFSSDMSKRGFARDAVCVLPLYEKGNLASGAVDWAWNEAFGTLSAEVGHKLDAAFAGRPKEQWNTPVTAMVYSGNFAPFFDAVNARPHLPISTIVAVGPAFFKHDGVDRQIKNPNVKLLLNVYGSKDELRLIGLTGPMSHFLVPVVNVKLLGVGHMDYFYKPNPSEMSEKARVLTVTLGHAATKGQEAVLEYLKRLVVAGKATYDSDKNEFSVKVRQLSQNELRGKR